jgi:predicted MPP superfamily phosphohydrolase
VVLYGLVNAARLRVTRVTVALPNLPPVWKGRTAALVSDLHLGNIHGAGFARRVVARLAALDPDAVFIAGDLFDGAAIDQAAAAAPWGKWVASLGIYFAAGNHDFAHRADALTAVRSAGIRVLDNAAIDLQGVQVVGVNDAEASDPGRFREILSLARLRPGVPSILLSHRPANLAIAEEAGISLQLSGHTHAGQFWPWNFLTRRIYGPFAYGLHRFRRLLVLTSSGVGTWGPPLRIGTRSEIVLIRFE